MRLMVTQEFIQMPDGRKVFRGEMLTPDEQALLENPEHDEETGVSTNHMHLLRGVVQVGDDHPLAATETQPAPASAAPVSAARPSAPAPASAPAPQEHD